MPIDVFPIGADIKFLIEQDQISEQILDLLIGIVKNAIQNAKNQEKKVQLERWLLLLKHFKTQEEKHKKQNDEHLDTLENMMDQL